MDHKDKIKLTRAIVESILKRLDVTGMAKPKLYVSTSDIVASDFKDYPQNAEMATKVEKLITNMQIMLLDESERGILNSSKGREFLIFRDIDGNVGLIKRHIMDHSDDVTINRLCSSIDDIEHSVDNRFIAMNDELEQISSYSIKSPVIIGTMMMHHAIHVIMKKNDIMGEDESKRRVTEAYLMLVSCDAFNFFAGWKMNGDKLVPNSELIDHKMKGEMEATENIPPFKIYSQARHAVDAKKMIKETLGQEFIDKIQSEKGSNSMKDLAKKISEEFTDDDGLLMH